MRQQISEILEKARGIQIICVGDLMLDRYVYGGVGRVSPEAPVPVLRKTSSTEVPGGAGNVARNLSALGLRTIMIGCVGDDEAGTQLTDLLEADPLISCRLVRTGNMPTVIKTRFIAGTQQLLRVDTEDDKPDLADASLEIGKLVDAAAKTASLIIVSDYAKGAINPAVFDACIKAARANDIPVLVDPKSKDFSIYAGASLIKPNASELAAASGLPTASDSDVDAALSAMANLLPDTRLVVTRAGKGMSWHESSTTFHMKGEARQVFDVSGAGDTSMAALAAAIAAGSVLKDAVALAIAASGIVVGKVGTATVSAEELHRALSAGEAPVSAGLLNRADIAELAVRWRASGLRVGFTNGCFDILHPGHLRVLRQARAQCDRLIVAINTDASVKRLKGESRPVNTEQDRAELLAGIAGVDAVTSFDEDTPAELIKAIQPDVLVKGGDYKADEIVGADTVRARGGEVVIVPLLEGRSTTGIIERSRS
ncbi:MAG TPA: D-glycero-beta-D-manno-heptose 1-phosphate adenylyltransferase [Henriciella marina]|uniref:D-glycero-beta-D-manno-heptose 1-phosphate adenylyltransferase n=1 Tax=Henriciella sp. TaxID=1968823 RepID=UPI0017C3C2C2|nr:D-glycero-beta-D-manno-heptose 1-phosphate adenylyltransferase [Henriciella sp.]HIG22084.1 D-glycero-beta-D-manno-heptose 1-phosphate adenylyltransferase [Henriciella sp.]HIK65307.1 D-glycero-beta-D-manno-heptose 1-phosphate adenylyltransferase [Henriciella marina]